MRSCTRSPKCTSSYIQQDIVEVHGTWLKTFAWNWFASFTFRRPVSPAGCDKLFREYLKEISRCSGTASYAVWLTERSKVDHRLHVHALVGGVGYMPHRCRLAARDCVGCGTHLWDRGFAEVREYDPSLPGIFYTLKTLGIKGSELQIEGTPALKISQTG